VEGGRSRGDTEDDSKTAEQIRRDKQAEAERDAATAAEAAAKATFAVLRSYDFPAANAALNAPHSSGNTAGGVTGTTDREGDGNKAGGSSVYQSVYRSVFASSKGNTAGASSSKEVLENDDPNEGPEGRAKRKTTPANVFYIVASPIASRQ